MRGPRFFGVRAFPRKLSMHTGDFPLIGGLHKCPDRESYKPGGGILGRPVCISICVLFETLFFLVPFDFCSWAPPGGQTGAVWWLSRCWAKSSIRHGRAGGRGKRRAASTERQKERRAVNNRAETTGGATQKRARLFPDVFNRGNTRLFFSGVACLRG